MDQKLKSLKKIDNNATSAFEENVLMKKYGSSINESTGERRIRKNNELQDLYQRTSITE